MIPKIFIFILGAGLTACSFGTHTAVKGTSIPLDTTYRAVNAVDSIIMPYKSDLDKEMNQVIAFAEVDFINQRPSGNLGNLVADIILSKGNETLLGKPVICLLNFGGLRAPISKGNVTLGDIFKVMPFDNQLMVVKMPAASIYEIRDYLRLSGGEPVAGFCIRQQAVTDASGAPWKDQDFWIITSDYLFNGGDKMNFFRQHLESVNTGILLRDIITDYVKSHPVLQDRSENRVQL